MSPEPPETQSEVTQLLRHWRSGQAESRDRLIEVVYDQLRRLAAYQMKRERPGHTLKPTALVHEAYLRLVGAEVDWQDRAHFSAVAAQTMRRVLIDHARSQVREKRGGDSPRVTLDDRIAAPSGDLMDVLELDQAMRRLSTLNPRKSTFIELHYFGGLTYEQSAEVLDVSLTTVHRELKLAKAWLRNQLARSA